MSNVINIKGLDKAKVLSALYNASKQQGMGFMHIRGASGMSVNDAQELINQHREKRWPLDFDYLHGRVMKVSIEGDEIHPDLYDRDIGQGAAARALSPLFQAA